MDNREFVNLATKYANRTNRIRIYSQEWSSGACRNPDDINNAFGSIILLLQELLDQGKLCRAEEGLLIYNFQFSTFSKSWYTLDMIIKPLKELEETDKLTGARCELLINGDTGDVVNTAQALSELVLAGELEEEYLEDEGCPEIYGNFKELLYKEGEARWKRGESKQALRLFEHKNIISASQAAKESKADERFHRIEGLFNREKNEDYFSLSPIRTCS